MPETVATLIAELKADIRDFDAKMSSARRELKQMEGATDTAGRQTDAFAGKLKKLAGPAVLGAAAVAMTRFAVSAVKDAAELAESANAVEVVFGSSAKKIKEFADGSIDSVGLASVRINQSATILGSALQNVGFSADEAADKTIMLTERAADMASVFNTDVDDALGAIQSALRGEADPIEKFGVSLSAAKVEAKALALGLAETKGALTETDKAAARLALIMEQTDKVAGDYANTADSVANAQKRVNERWLEGKAAIGDKLLPAAGSFLKLFENLIPIVVNVGEVIATLLNWTLVPLVDVLADAAALLNENSDESEQYARAVEEVNDRWGEGAQFGSRFSSAVSATGVSMDDSAYAAWRNEQAIKDMHDEMDAGRHGRRTINDDLDDIEESADEAAKATLELEAALKRLLNPVFNLRSATDKYNEAFDEVVRLAVEGKTATDEYVDAALELAEAEADLEAARSRYAREGGADSIEALRETWKLAGLSADEIDRLIRMMDILNSTGLTPGLITPPSVGGFKKFHSGGIVPGPIGSNQLVMAAGGETILPTHRSDYQGGGDTYNIDITLTDDVLDPMASRRFVRNLARELDNFRIETRR